MTRSASMAIGLLAAVAVLALSGCAASDSKTPPRAPGSSTHMPHETPASAASANTEQLELIAVLEAAAVGRWDEPKVEQFRSCTTDGGESGVQLTRSVRGSGMDDPGTSAEEVQAALSARGFEAEIRRTSEVVATGPGLRYAAFNSVDGISIIQVYSFCYPFDIVHDDPTVPSSELPAS